MLCVYVCVGCGNGGQIERAREFHPSCHSPDAVSMATLCWEPDLWPFRGLLSDPCCLYRKSCWRQETGKDIWQLLFAHCVAACVGVCIGYKVWPSLKSNMSQTSKLCDRTWSVFIIILWYLRIIYIRLHNVSFLHFRRKMLWSGTRFKACVNQWNLKKSINHSSSLSRFSVGCNASIYSAKLIFRY